MTALRKLSLIVVVLLGSATVACEGWVPVRSPASPKAGVCRRPETGPPPTGLTRRPTLGWERVLGLRPGVNPHKAGQGSRRRLATTGLGIRIGGVTASPLGAGWQWRGWSAGGSTPRPTLTLAKAPASGSEEALVTVILFYNFRCYYGNYVWSAFIEMKREFPGMFRLYFKHHQINRYNKVALEAAEAAMAAHAQGKFWEMADILFQNRYNINAKNLETYAEEIGLKMAPFKAAMKKGTYRGYVEADVKESKQFLARNYGCPTVWVNGQRNHGYISSWRLKNMLRQAAKEVQGIRIRPLL